MKFSLNKKTIVLIVSIAALISILAIIIYDKGIQDVIEQQYEERSVDIARLVATEIDTQRLLNVKKAVRDIYDHTENRILSDQWGTPEFEAYVSLYNSIYDMEDYKILLTDLRRMQDVLDVECLYLIWLDIENGCYVYLVDAAYEETCPVGCIDPLYTDDPEVRTNPEAGLPPTISNTPEYGWLLATGMPIHGDQGEIIAEAALDISMNEIMSRRYHFLLYVELAFLIMSVLVSVSGILLVNRTIVRPIKILTQAAAQYARNRNVFSELKMKSSDEIGMLAESMKHMEEEINGYISNLEKTTKDLISAREHAEQMDMAANIDALTKVRNKRAYEIEVTRLNGSKQPYGIAMIDMNGLKEINDTFGHEKGDISINKVCRITCRVFKHSPVFRVGGDEFVVILENSDFIERATLIQSIMDEFDQSYHDTSLPPWERVSAAAGLAIYDSDLDDSVDSVLKRADASMYEYKRAWKETHKGYHS